MISRIFWSTRNVWKLSISIQLQIKIHYLSQLAISFSFVRMASDHSDMKDVEDKTSTAVKQVALLLEVAARKGQIKWKRETSKLLPPMAMNLSNDEMMLLVKIYFPLAVAAERNMQNHEAEDGSLMDIKKGDIWHAPEWLFWAICCGREACGGPQLDDDYGGSRLLLLLILNLTWVMDFIIWPGIKNEICIHRLNSTAQFVCTI